jgi:hypothetical protein
MPKDTIIPGDQNNWTNPKKRPAAGPGGAVGIAQRFPRAGGIPQEFQAREPPPERPARQLPQGIPINYNSPGGISLQPQYMGVTHSKPGRTINYFKLFCYKCIVERVF